VERKWAMERSKRPCEQRTSTLSAHLRKQKMKRLTTRSNSRDKRHSMKKRRRKRRRRRKKKKKKKGWESR
jgi:hypothetical protein